MYMPGMPATNKENYKYIRNQARLENTGTAVSIKYWQLPESSGRLLHMDKNSDRLGNDCHERSSRRAVTRSYNQTPIRNVYTQIYTKGR